MKAILLSAVALLALPAGAAGSGDDERARLAQERAAIESHFQARDKECRARFVVSACVEEVQRERRDGLDGLKARQRVLDEARRRERAESRRAELAAKASDDARREVERTARAAGAADKAEARAAAPPKPPASAAPWSRRSKPVGKGTAAERAAREAESRRGYERRRQEADAHRQEAAVKEAQRSKKRPPAKPLPLPGAVP